MITQTSPEIQRRDIDGKGRTIWELFNNRLAMPLTPTSANTSGRPSNSSNSWTICAGNFKEHYRSLARNATRSPNSGHYFLGSIILSQKKGESYIIDGQQRLTTLTLFLIHLHHRQAKLTEDERVDVSALILSEKVWQKILQH